MDVAQRISQLANELESYKGELKGKVADLDARLAKVSEKEAELKKADEKLTAREGDVAGIENLVELKKSADVARKDADVALGELSKAKDLFRQERVAHDDKVQLEKQQIQNDREMTKKEWEILKAAQVKLAEDKENYKQKVLEELGKKVK